MRAYATCTENWHYLSKNENSEYLCFYFEEKNYINFGCQLNNYSEVNCGQYKKEQKCFAITQN